MKKQNDQLPSGPTHLTRRELLRIVAAASLVTACSARRTLAVESARASSIEDIRARTLVYIERMRLAGKPYGRYRYAAGVEQATLYSSTYAAMTRDLYGDLKSLTQVERAEWIEHLQSHQDDDGLFRDPIIFGEGWYKDDPEWCGRRHLTCHVISALTCLGTVAAKPMRFLEPFLKPDALARWLEARDWQNKPDYAGNEVLNVGTLLQYARDFQQDERCRPAMRLMLDWLSAHHLDTQSGLWGKLDLNSPKDVSRGVMAAYHFWLLYFYDGVPVPHAAQAVDFILKTQNREGGYGQGVHGPVPDSSACEDIDSIDPLCRLLSVAPERGADIRVSLERGLRRVLVNQNADGGYVFKRNSAFEYGHPLLASGYNESGMFPTWFRTLSLAYLGQALPGSIAGRYAWRFTNAPGCQFWHASAKAKSTRRHHE